MLPAAKQIRFEEIRYVHRGQTGSVLLKKSDFCAKSPNPADFERLCAPNLSRCAICHLIISMDRQDTMYIGTRSTNQWNFRVVLGGSSWGHCFPSETAGVSSGKLYGGSYPFFRAWKLRNAALQAMFKFWSRGLNGWLKIQDLVWKVPCGNTDLSLLNWPSCCSHQHNFKINHFFS